MQKRLGRYAGTEIDGKWWKRYTERGMFARGVGEYWFDETAFYFHRYLTRTPMVIPYKDINHISAGSWHSGQWAAGQTFTKVWWNDGSRDLCSGFIVARNVLEHEKVREEFLEHIGASNKAL